MKINSRNHLQLCDISIIASSQKFWYLCEISTCTVHGYITFTVEYSTLAFIAQKS